MAAIKTPSPAEIRADLLKHLEARYRKSRNPVDAWAAIAEALIPEPLIEGPCEIPAFAMEYLRRCAIAIHELTTDPPRRDQVAPAIAKALEFSRRGAGTAFTDAHRDAHEFAVAATVYQIHSEYVYKQKRGKGPTPDWRSVFQDAADRHNQSGFGCCSKRIGWKTVERIWRAKALSVIPPHVIARTKSKKLDDILR
jgi:hypothetical protein